MTEAPPPPGHNEAGQSELDALRAEVARLRQALLKAERQGARDEKATSVERLQHTSDMAVSEDRAAEARIDAKAAWEKAAAISAELGRVMAEGVARLRVSQATVASMERVNAALAASQATIAAREAELRTMVDSAIGLAILATDTGGNVVFWNVGAERLLAVDPSRIASLSFAEVVPLKEDPGGSLAEAVTAAFRGERVSVAAWPLWQGEARLWLGVEAMPLGEEGAAVGVLWLLRDRTETYMAELALRESEARHRALLAASSYAVYRMSPDWSVMLAMEGAGFLADAPHPSRSWLDGYILPEDRPVVWQAIGEAIRTKQPFQLEHRVRQANGGTGWTLSRAVPRLDEAGVIREWFGAASDVTARRRVEEALGESERRLAIVFEALPVGAGVVDRKGVLVRQNGEMRRFLPTGAVPSQDPARANRWRAWKEDGTRLEPRDYPAARALRGESTLGRQEFLYTADDGGERWTRVAATPLCDEKEEITGAAVVVADIDEIKRAQEVARANEERQAFLLKLSDALRPLADPAEIEGEATRLLGDHLGAGRAYYVEVREAEGYATIARDHVRGGLPSLIGHFPLAAFGWVLALYRKGRPIVVRDLHTSDLMPAADRAAMEAVRIVAWGAIPLVKGGELVGALCVTEAVPRDWTEAEIALVETTAERIWAAVERARAEAALKASEERYRTLFESIDEGFSVIEMLFDKQGQAIDYVFRETNPVFEQQAGFKIVPGQRMREIAPDHEQYWFDTYGRIALTGEPARFEHHAKSFGIVYDVYAFRVDEPELRRVAVLFRDITARKRAEDALRESEARFRGFAENSADVLWITNADGTALDYLSPAFERVFGEPRDRILADLGRFTELLHPEDRTAVAGFLPRTLAGETAIVHYRVVRPSDGGVVYLRDTGFPIRDGDGTISRAAGVVQDVSDLHEAAVAREADKERFRTLAEGIPQLVWRAARDGSWTWASPQWRAYTGQTGESSKGAGWLDALHPADREAALVAWKDAEALGAYQADFRLRHASSGHHVWFQARGVPLRDAGGALVEWLGACANIDDQVRARGVLEQNAKELDARVRARTAELMTAEAALRQSQKMEAIGQLTGGIAHDFNNMLQGVVGGLDMARRRLEEGRAPDVARYTAAARDAAIRAAGLTRRLLAFARRQQLRPVPLDSDALVRGMEDLLRRSVGPAVAMDFQLRDGAGHVLCDPSELESTVLNLCINARDAMPGGGQLTVATDDVRLSATDIAPHESAEPGEFVSIRVEDTGTGMTPEILEHVLEPFFTTKPQGEGTGLGLSQVYGFVRQSGGVLRLVSAPGRGTTVQILLPRQEASVAEARVEQTEAPAAHAGHGKTVLLVDDETAVRVPAAERLRDLGYRVIEAEDGPKAVRFLDEGLRPDILVTDVGLPNGLDGRAVAEQARQRWPDLPVVFATGYAHVALPDDAVVVTKPFDLDVLAKRIGMARRRSR